MASEIVMFDAVDISQIPAGPAAVAGYVDGAYQTAPLLAARFPHAKLLTIAVNPAHDAEGLDVETGDAAPEDAPGWTRRQEARKVQRPCLYASVEPMQDEVIPVLKAAGITRASVRLWTAHYAGKHICGPSTCGELSTDADGTQWTDQAFGRPLDQSLLAAGFFAVPPPPAPSPQPPPVPAWQEAIMNALPVLSEGSDDTRLPHEYVRRVQLIANGIYHASPELAVDGVYGEATKSAVAAVQHGSGITVDGVVGPATWRVLVTGSAS